MSDLRHMFHSRSPWKDQPHLAFFRSHAREGNAHLVSVFSLLLSSFSLSCTKETHITVIKPLHYGKVGKARSLLITRNHLILLFCLLLLGTVFKTMIIYQYTSTGIFCLNFYYFKPGVTGRQQAAVLDKKRKKRSCCGWHTNMHTKTNSFFLFTCIYNI